jgi:cation diffusion facilitator family transporter
MRDDNLQNRQHSHSFGQENKRPGERKTFITIIITALMMVIEIVAGILFGSMALLADGLHMASHAVALSINFFAYVYARRHAHNPRYSFGTGKVNALGGFTGAVLLAMFSLLMAWESIGRLIQPAHIIFNQAIFVAVLGLIVNGICVFILDTEHHHAEHPEHSDDHHHDHNLKSAYLHVMADALTSVLAIVALLTAKYLGFVWMDPVMGIFGSILVARWSYGLLRSTGYVLLDQQGPESIRQKIRESIEEDMDSKVTDMHLWSIGPEIYAAILSVAARTPATPEQYKARIPDNFRLEHISIEIHQCGTTDPEEIEDRLKPDDEMQP